MLISENRPEWMISDLSIMLSKGIRQFQLTQHIAEQRLRIYY